MDKVNLSGILNNRKLKATLPSNLKYKELPMVSYKFSHNIGHTLFNYNNVLRNLSASEIVGTTTCDCLTNTVLRPFVYTPHGHVHTGNLDIIGLPELKTLMHKGANFRECPYINSKKYLAVLCQHVDYFIVKWAKKEGLTPSNFDKYSSVLKSIIKSKLAKLNFFECHQILSQDNVKEYLSQLHDKYVICPIDKASHNFAIVCKSFYIQVLKKSLGDFI